MADRWERLAPLSGVAFVVLLIGGSAIINEWGYLPAGSDLVERYEDNSIRMGLGAYVGATSAFFLVWFAGSLRTRLREAEGAPGRLAAVAFGGGVGAATLMTAGFGSMMAAANRGGEGIPEATVIGLHDLAGALVGNVAVIMLAVMVVATAVVGLRTDTFPRWFSWVSLVLGALLLSPIAWAVLIAVPVWVAWMAITMYRREPVPATV